MDGILPSGITRSTNDQKVARGIWMKLKCGRIDIIEHKCRATILEFVPYRVLPVRDLRTREGGKEPGSSGPTVDNKSANSINIIYYYYHFFFFPLARESKVPRFEALKGRSTIVAASEHPLSCTPLQLTFFTPSHLNATQHHNRPHSYTITITDSTWTSQAVLHIYALAQHVFPPETPLQRTAL